MSKGFTLIELLVVIAVLGILATITIVAVNPLEQVAKTNDSKTKQAVSQVGGALTAYLAQSQSFPTANTTWMQVLVDSGNLSDRPDTPENACSPAASSDSNYCLQVSGTPASAAVIYARLSSQGESVKCTNASDVPYFIYDTARGRSCLICGSATATFASGATCTADN